MDTDYKSIFLEGTMNAVGIDVSKGKSTIAVIRPFGEVVKAPFDVAHTVKELGELSDFILSLEGEARVVIEHTGKYSEPIANALCEAGIFVCMVNAKLIHDYGGETIRRVKTDKADALKIAGYCLDKWVKLAQYTPEDELRKTLKTYNRQLSEYAKMKTMLKNNLISLLDQTFPGINKLFTSTAREPDGHEKWIDFVSHFWHCECVSALSQSAFSERYKRFCRKHGYNFSTGKAEEIYFASAGHFGVLPRNSFTKTLMLQAVAQLNSLCEVVAALKIEMNKIASQLPEYEIVLAMHGVGKVLGAQLMAEIGDIRRYPKRSSLARFAGIEPPENQSGIYSQHSRRISKQGSPHLRRTLFQVMCCVLQLSHNNEPTFQFLDRKRADGKPYKVYMIAGANKFLRIYYARVKECFDTLESLSTGIDSTETVNNNLTCKQDRATVETDPSGYAGTQYRQGKTAARIC
jgi:transposase